jgi:hypothetical protein
VGINLKATNVLVAFLLREIDFFLSYIYPINLRNLFQRPGLAAVLEFYECQPGTEAN